MCKFFSKVKRLYLTTSAGTVRLILALAVLLPMMAGVAEAAGLSGVQVGAQVEFRHYELIKVMSGYFTLETGTTALNPHQIELIGKWQVVVVL